ncbi:MAG: nitroreductase family protein [Candidatus Hodarchaeota archaeon]
MSIHSSFGGFVLIKIDINQTSCIQCGACADICYARDVFEIQENGPVVVHPEKCRLCGHCVAVCPTDSINHEKILLQYCPKIDQQLLPSLDVLIPTLRTRRSYRRYKDRPVSRDILQDLISHSRWIPTGYNRQYLDWIIFTGRRKIDNLLKTTLKEVKRNLEQGKDSENFLGLSIKDIDNFLENRAAREKRFFFNAPVLIAGYCDKDTVCAREEATYATYNITLTAERIGLGTCHIGSVQLIFEELPHLQQELLRIPIGKELQVFLIAGYPSWRFRRMVPRRLPKINWNP